MQALSRFSNQYRWALCAAVATALVSCSSGSHTPSLSTSTRGQATSTSSPASAIDPTAAVERVVIQDADLSTGEKRQLIEGGDQVAGQVTLDFCGYNYTSEANRTARRQYEISSAGNPTFMLSNEVVAYDTTDHAAAALSEWFDAVSHCPPTWTPPEQGAPKLTSKITSNRRNETDLPVKANIVTTATVSVPGEGTLYSQTSLQVQGQVLDIIWSKSPKPLSSAEITEVNRLGTVTGQRLASSS